MGIDDAKRQRICAGCSCYYAADCPAQCHLRYQPRLVRVDAGDRAVVPRRESDCLRAGITVGDRQHRAAGIPAQRVWPIIDLQLKTAAQSTAAPTGVASQNGMVGAPYDALKQACYGAQKDRLLLVQYETLTTDPAKTMHAIYAFIDEPAFEHDFDHIDYAVTECDERAGTRSYTPWVPPSRPSRVRACCRRTCSSDLSTTPSGAIRRIFPRGCRSCEVSSTLNERSRRAGHRGCQDRGSLQTYVPK